MTLLGQCSIGVSIIFWQVFSLSALAYSVAFIFYPTDANKIFVTPLPENVVRYLGTMFLFAGAAVNHLAEVTLGMFKLFASVSTILFYMLALVGGLVVISLDSSIFLEMSTIVMQVLYGIMIAGFTLPVLSLCIGYCRFDTTTDSTTLETVEVTTNSRRPPIGAHVSRDDVRKGRY